MTMRSIRLSQKAKDQLVKLKRVTGIEQWNTLCRWALCVSFANPKPPADAEIPADSNVEMTWAVFGGDHADIYYAVLQQCCVRDGMRTNEATLAKQLRLHLHRGISYLAGDNELDDIGDLLAKAL